MIDQISFLIQWFLCLFIHFHYLIFSPLLYPLYFYRKFLHHTGIWISYYLAYFRSSFSFVVIFQYLQFFFWQIRKMIHKIVRIVVISSIFHQNDQKNFNYSICIQIINDRSYHISHRFRQSTKIINGIIIHQIQKNSSRFYFFNICILNWLSQDLMYVKNTESIILSLIIFSWLPIICSSTTDFNLILFLFKIYIYIYMDSAISFNENI